MTDGEAIERQWVAECRAVVPTVRIYATTIGVDRVPNEDARPEVTSLIPPGCSLYMFAKR